MFACFNLYYKLIFAILLLMVQHMMLGFGVFALEIAYVTSDFWDDTKDAFDYVINNQDHLDPGSPIDRALDVITEEIERMNQER